MLRSSPPAQDQVIQREKLASQILMEKGLRKNYILSIYLKKWTQRALQMQSHS
jgi:hypothetical protein